MRFLAAEIRSFARFTQPTALPLDQQGLVLVEGRNYDNGDAFDSNGAGKSMLFEAIKWCLFGKMSRYGDERLGGEEVTFDGHPADVLVWFESARGTFEVHRQRGVTGAPTLAIRVQEHGAWVPMRNVGVHAAEGTDSLVNLLGFDYQTLRYALTLEGTSLDIASSGFSAQMKILESILRFDVYTEAKKLAAVRAKDIQRDIDRDLNEMERQQTIAQHARAAVVDLEALDESVRERELEIEIESARVALTERAKFDAKLARARASGTLAHEQDARCKLALEHARAHVKSLRDLGSASAQADVACPACGQTVTEAYVGQALISAEENLTSVETAYNLAHENSTRLQETVWAIDADVRALDLRAQQVKTHERELRDLRERTAKRRAAIAAQSQRVTDAESTLATLTESVASTRRDLQHTDFWARRGFDDLKHATLAAATPVLNEAASRYGQVLSDGAIAVTFDTFRESRSDDLIRASGETGPRYESLSNGEKRRVQVIVALALRALARWRIGEPINFAVWDEVFDPLDESGIARAVQVLQQDTDELSSVFVITHNPAMKALFPGARTLRVVREHGVSRVEA